MAAPMELDRVFVKALKLMQSKSKDSADQLKQMLDDAIAQRRAAKSKQSFADNERPSPMSASSQKTKLEEEKKKEAEKRTLEKLKNEISELSSEPKRPKLETSHVKEEKKEPIIEKDRKDASKEKELSKKQVEEFADVTSDSEVTDIEGDDFGFDMGNACCVCRLFDISPGNQLVECVECHNLYHQECHLPPVTEQDVNDPRFVWYCSRCSKTLKKMVAKPPKAKVILSSSAKDKEQESFTKALKSPNTNTNPFQFRRSEPKLSTSKETGNGTAAKPMSGFESLAANLSGRSLLESPSAKTKIEQLKQISWSKGDGVKSAAKTEKTVSASHSDSSVNKATLSSKPATKATNWIGSATMAAINAEKKLQFVKKRAAAKVTDKKHYK